MQNAVKISLYTKFRYLTMTSSVDKNVMHLLKLTILPGQSSSYPRDPLPSNLVDFVDLLYLVR